VYCPHSVACSLSVYWPVVLTGSGLHCVATVLGVNSVVVGVELMSERHEAAMLMAERLHVTGRCPPAPCPLALPLGLACSPCGGPVHWAVR
jgi:hypothetical protein